MLLRARLPAVWRRIFAPAGAASLGAAAAVILALASCGATSGTGATASQWPVAGQNLGNTRFQAAEHDISPAAVSRLRPKWTLTTHGNVPATPTVYAGVVYVPDQSGTLWAADAKSGRVLWSHSIVGYTGVPGDGSRTSPAVYRGELITGDGWGRTVASGARVLAVDRMTGGLLWSAIVDTHPASIITSSPVVYGGVAYVGIASAEELLSAAPGYQCCTFRGVVVALDATTGRQLWRAYTVPSDDNGADANRPGFYSGGAVWGSAPVVDARRGLLYVGTGNNYTVPYGVCTKPGEKRCAPPAADDRVDSILALRLRDGSVAWADRTLGSDVFNGSCQPSTCAGDLDFGSAPNLFTTTDPATGQPEQLLGIGQKSGVYWAVDPGTGKIVWTSRVGPEGPFGGIQWGSAADGRHVYVAEADSGHVPYRLGGSGPDAGRTVTGGSWAALDAATGKILWQTPDPQAAADMGFVTAAGGVVYAGSMAVTGQNMYTLDAATGKILWRFASGGPVLAGAAVVDGDVYWGSGYNVTTCPPGEKICGNNDKLYAFTLG